MSEPKKGEIVPFGKYKDQPIEALAEDKKYADWLVAQPWFRERYGNLYAIVINNFCEPSETPEHNALQARFLDDQFQLQFASIIAPRLWWHSQMDGEMIQQLAAGAAAAIQKARPIKDAHNLKETSDYEERLAKYEQGKAAGSLLYKFASEPAKPRTYKIALACDTNCRGGELANTSPPAFEVDGLDCQFYVFAGAGYRIEKAFEDDRFPGGDKIIASDRQSIQENLKIEIKPEIGDDYPAILRQMRRNGATIIFTRAYTGQGVDEATFIRFMESQGIRVIFESDVEDSEKISVDIFDDEKFRKLVREKIESTES